MKNQNSFYKGTDMNNNPHTVVSRTVNNSRIDKPMINNCQALTQLKLLGYVKEESVHLRFFYPSDDPRKANDHGVKLDAVCPHLPWQRIQELQDDGRGCYFVVNGGGHKDAEVIKFRAIFYEHDNIGKDMQIDLWKGLELPEPTFQLDTGGKSIHSYWVLSEDITEDQWRTLQSDLLKYADADRSIKNPSRVMRLAGCFHSSGEQSTIISSSGHRYGYHELRSQIPVTQTQVSSDWATFDKNFRMPIPQRVPLRECLSRQSRDLIDRGAGSGERNDRGAALARDLIGAADALRGMGQDFEGDALELFEQYAKACTPPIEASEVEALWKSAQSSNPGASLSPEHIEGCVKGWSWRNRPVQTEAWEEKPKTFKQSQESAVSQENGYADFRRAVAATLLIEDPHEQRFTQLRLKSRFSVPQDFVDSVISSLLMPTNQKASKTMFTLAELADYEETAATWDSARLGCSALSVSSGHAAVSNASPTPRPVIFF